MYKKIVPTGTKMSFPQIISDVQDFSLANSSSTFGSLVQQYGIVSRHVDGLVTGDELKPVIAGLNTIDFTAPGTAVFAKDSLVISASGTGKQVYNLDNLTADSDYQLIMVYSGVGSEPVGRTEGFVYPSGVAANTKLSPTYRIWAVPTSSGLQDNHLRIGSGILNGNSLDAGSFNDNRPAFILNADVVDPDVVFMLDRDNVYPHNLTIQSGLTVYGNSIVDNGICVFDDQVYIGGALTFYQNNAVLSGRSFNFRDSAGNFYFSAIDSGVNNFMVEAKNGLITKQIHLNTGSTLSLYGSDNQYVGDVITTGEVPTNPQNLRIYDINGDKYSIKGSIVTVKWNYDDLLISGVSAGATSVTTNTDPPFLWDTKGTDDTFMMRWKTITTNSLVGKYLYFPYTQNRYQITANNDWSETVSGIGFTFNLASGLADSDAALSRLEDNFNYIPPCRIIDDADSYLMTVERVPTTAQERRDYLINISNFKETYILPQEYVTDPKYTLNLPTDDTYRIWITAQKKFNYSDKIALNDGYPGSFMAFSKDQKFDGTDVYYEADQVFSKFFLTNKIPFDLTGTVSAVPTAFGFRLTIGGYYDEDNPENNPHDFEVIYTTAGKPDDWSTVTGDEPSGQYTRITTTSRNIDIPTVEKTQYYIAVWPRMGSSRLVTTPKTADVTGGAGGVFPDNGVICNTRFSVRSWAVQLNNLDEINAVTAFSPGEFNNSSYQTFGVDPQDVLGSVIVESGVDAEYRITDAKWKDSSRNEILITTAPIGGASSNQLSGVCYINTTKTGRRIYKSLNMPIDYQLVSASLNIDSGDGLSAGSPGIIRIYQDGLDIDNSGAVDFLEVQSVPSEQVAALDETVQGSRGNRTLVIDAFDPDDTSPNNLANFTGEITVNATPLIIRTGGGRTIPNINSL